MKKPLLTLAISLTLAAPLSFAADNCQTTPAYDDHRKTVDARFAAHRAEMQKMRDAFRQQMPAAPRFQAVAQDQDWSKLAEQQRQQMEAQLKAQQAQFAAAQKQQAEFAKQMQEQAAKNPVQFPSFADAQKAHKEQVENMRKQQEERMKTFREQRAQFKPAAFPQAEQARKSRQEYSDTLRKQQLEQMQAMQDQMHKFIPGHVKPVSLLELDGLRDKTPEQRREFFKNLAEQQKSSSKAEFAQFETQMKGMREQFEKFTPVAHFSGHKDVKAEMEKRRAEMEKRRVEAEKRYQDRQACMNKV